MINCGIHLRAIYCKYTWHQLLARLLKNHIFNIIAKTDIVSSEMCDFQNDDIPEAHFINMDLL